MEKTRITDICSLSLPAEFSELVCGADVYDSSCSNAARVYFIDKYEGFYLKCARLGSLKKQAEMTNFFASKGLTAPVLAYKQDDKDWLLTKSVKGEDCIDRGYLAQPQKLCDTLAEIMDELHNTDYAGCPNMHRTDEYLALAESNFCKGIFSKNGLSKLQMNTPEQAFKLVMDNKSFFEQNTLIHGDFCLPNIMLDNWRFSGFIDVDNAGVSDRHIDIYWVLWSLEYNLKTTLYNDRFMSAYGKDKINTDMLRVIAAAEVFG